MKTVSIGYTAGCFDILHVGHINLFRNAKGLCSKLIVGVSTDELVSQYKGRKPIFPFEQRIEIVRSLRYVDVAIPQTDRDKLIAHRKLKYEILFVGDDWYDSSDYKQWEIQLSERGCSTIYFPYTSDVSSSMIRSDL